MAEPEDICEDPQYTRRLVGVMFTDILGYSSKAADDELRALHLVHEHNALLTPIIQEYRGEVVKTIGDSIMGRFHSVIRAVECAVAMQQALQEFNSSRPESEQLLIRIGVHAGDVFQTSESDLFGHDVNIAARLESLAEPGSVVVTETVYVLARGKTNLAFHHLGEFSLKNIGTPLRVYRVMAHHGIGDDVPDSDAVTETEQQAGECLPSEPVRAFGRYRLFELLGAGGMGEVWLAEDTHLERKVAIKLLPHHAAADESDRIRFLREAKATAQLDHPNIAQVYEIGEEEGELFIAMAYVDGGSVKDRLNAASGRPLPLDEVLDWILQAAEGLAEAHRHGIIHRDIKPDNLMLAGTGLLKITDFGLARLDTSTKLTASGSTLGTVNYMSPEQALGSDVDHRCDLFSLGATLYELLTGRPPFEGPDASAIYYSILHDEPDPIYRYRRDIDPALELLVSKLLQKDSRLRYQSAKEVVADLKRLKSDSTVLQAAVRSRTARARRAAGTRVFAHPAASKLAIALGSVLIMAAIWYFGIRPSPGAEFEKLTIGVTDLIFTDVEAGEAYEISNRLRLHLGRHDVFNLIEVPDMDSALEDLGFQISGTCDFSDIVAGIGSDIGAQLMVDGTITKLGDLFSLQVRVINSETAHVEYEDYVDVRGVEQLLTRATRKIAGKLAKVVPDLLSLSQLELAVTNELTFAELQQFVQLLPRYLSDCEKVEVKYFDRGLATMHLQFKGTTADLAGQLTSRRWEEFAIELSDRSSNGVRLRAVPTDKKQ